MMIQPQIDVAVFWLLMIYIVLTRCYIPESFLYFAIYFCCFSTVKLTDPEYLYGLSFLTYFLLKFTIFVAIATMVDQEEVLINTRE